MVAQHPKASIYSHHHIGLGQDTMKRKILDHSGYRLIFHRMEKAHGE
jgi:hypothetical protein